jgi:hypothetical protein
LSSYSSFFPVAPCKTLLSQSMPSCNLSKTVHNKWLQQSGNRRNDLYVATIDDFVRALIQVSRYYQYFKGKHVGTGPRKKEFMPSVWHYSLETPRH